MEYTGKIMSRRLVLAALLLSLTIGVCACSRLRRPGPCVCPYGEKIKVVVVIAGHGFEEEPFFAMFDSFDDIEYVQARQQNQSEIFEDITGWDYDVIVLYNMTQEISPRRQANFVKLLNKGVGLVALHHSIGAFQKWGEYRRIIGGKYYLKAMEEDGVSRSASKYKHDVDIAVHVEDKTHPITYNMSDFVLNDETYKQCVFEKDNHVLLSTTEPTSDEPLCWVRQYGKARVCYIQLGHGSSSYVNADYRRLVGRAIWWCAHRLN